MDGEHNDYYQNKDEDFIQDNNRDKSDNKFNQYDSYNRSDSIEKNNEENENPLQNDFVDFITEEMSEPDIMYWCKDSEEAASLLRNCIKWMSSKNFTTMKRYLKEIVDSDTDTGNSSQINKVAFVKNFYMGVSHFKDAEYDEALHCFFEANKLYQYYQLHYNIALCCMKKNKLEEAVIYLEGVITKNQNFFFAYYNLIKIYLMKHNPGEAYVNYRKLSDVN